MTMTEQEKLDALPLVRDYLKEVLAKGEVKLVFAKKAKPGEEPVLREMRCTRSPVLLTEQDMEYVNKAVEKGHKESTTSVPVYDLDAAGWRSFTILNLREFNGEPFVYEDIAKTLGELQ
ncbi:hypothetical protein KNT64_gp215 [Pseudomonas phage PspYZU05]|uniref:Uncharacterized protein n=1 Tax=Pseudomonas phage PspYZU05 TaxID=1983556 RepID=A0A2U7NN57_9CAUD|nr:hypothetical protein KNT64_gp215 [Pseudomonas phage PspYZU05]ASD52167.1 hypothetical protein PspYZU05_215 [Pseudomonas phage PspYZU05]